MDMVNSFPDWYRSGNIHVDGDVVARRWEGVETAIGRVRPNDTMELAKLFVRNIGVTRRLSNRLVSYFQGADPSFGPESNAYELRVLAGCILGALFVRKPGDTADTAALALRCLTFQMTNQHGTPSPAILASAVSYLSGRSRAIRERVEPKLPVVPTLNFKDQLSAISSIQPGEAQRVAAPLKSVINTLAVRIRNFATSVQRFNRDQLTFLRAQDEELNIVWWLFSGASRDMDVSFADLTPASTCIIAARELADLTSLNLGPPGAQAYLEHMIRQSTGNNDQLNINLNAAVEEIDREWVASWIASRNSNWKIVVGANREALPVTYALFLKSDQDEVGVDWATRFSAKRNGVTISESMPGSSISLQFYDEQLLMKLIYNV